MSDAPSIEKITYKEVYLDMTKKTTEWMHQKKENERKQHKEATGQALDNNPELKDAKSATGLMSADALSAYFQNTALFGFDGPLSVIESDLVTETLERDSEKQTVKLDQFKVWYVLITSMNIAMIDLLLSYAFDPMIAYPSDLLLNYPVGLLLTHPLDLPLIPSLNRYKSENDKILAEELASKRLFASMLEEDFRDTEKKADSAQQGGKMLKGKEARRIIVDLRLNEGDDGAFKEWEKATMTEIPVVRKRR